LYREAEWAPGPVRTGAENLAPTGIFLMLFITSYTRYMIDRDKETKRKV
jgi:hypothetical protein